MKSAVALALAASMLLAPMHTVMAQEPDYEVGDESSESADGFNAYAGNEAAGYADIPDTPDYVIVLDPGHDNVHAGASGGGYREEYYNWLIALYCKAALEKYPGVKVYLTRETEDCAGGGRGVPSTTCNWNRVLFSKNHKADLYVCLHLNSAGASARGALVFYQNKSYKPGISEESYALAKDILGELKEAGVPQNGPGVLIRNSSDGSKYPDGSIRDYLMVLYGNKTFDIPAVLVENCFVSSPADREAFLSTKKKVKALGVANARGILKHLGITDTTMPENYTGLFCTNGEWCYYKNGEFDSTATDILVKHRGHWWYVKDGKLDTSFTGVIRNKNGDWYIENGRIQKQFTGLLDVHNTQIYKGEEITFDGLMYFKNGFLDKSVKTVVKVDGVWKYVSDGTINTTFTGIASNEKGTWFVQDGVVDFTFDGVVKDTDGIEWYVKKSKVQTALTGITEIDCQRVDLKADSTDTISGKYYLNMGKIDRTYTDVFKNPSDKLWYYVANGVFDPTANTVAKNKNGWWYIKDGKVDFTFNGLASNKSGIWYLEKGKINFGMNGVIKVANSTQKYPNEGGTLLTYGGWYYIKGGQVQTGSVTVQKNANGWWYIGTDGKVDFTFEGIASNQNGSWYLKGGKVQFGYTGTVTFDGVEYNIVKGKVIS